MSRESRERIDQIERRVLHVLCRRKALPESAREMLRDYRWRDPVHQIIFEILIAFPPGTPGVLREQLPVRLTRRGFPDVPCEDLFQPLDISIEDAQSLMRKLRDNS